MRQSMLAASASLALADDGEVFTGPCRAAVKTPLSRLPYFTRTESSVR